MSDVVFRVWFEERYRRQGEKKSTALQRFSLDAGVAYPTAYKLHRGQRVRIPIAERVRDFTEGAVPTESMLALGKT